MVVDPDEAAAMMRKSGLEPLVPYPGSKTPWRCIHTACDNEVTPLYNVVQQGGRGCQYCWGTGFDYNSPGQVYLLSHRELAAIKIGITGLDVTQGRIAMHQRQGWEVIAVIPEQDGRDAYAIEQMIMDWWHNDMDVRPAVPPSKMPQGGYTETAPIRLLTETLDILVEFGAEAV